MQQDLFDNITDALVEYKDPYRDFWRVGRGVCYEYNKRKRVTLVVVHPLAGKKRNLKLPLAHVRVYEQQSTRPISAPAAEIPEVTNAKKQKRARA